MENGFVGQKAFCAWYGCLALENERQQVFLAWWISIIWMSVPENIPMAFHHPKQVKIAVLVAEVSDSIAPCSALLSIMFYIWRYFIAANGPSAEVWHC